MLMSAPFFTRNCAVPACPSSAAWCRGVLWWGEISYTIINIAWLPDCIYPISLYIWYETSQQQQWKTILQTEYHTSSTLHKYMSNDKYLYSNDCIWVSFASLISSKHNTPMYSLLVQWVNLLPGLQTDWPVVLTRYLTHKTLSISYTIVDIISSNQQY